MGFPSASRYRIPGEREIGLYGFFRRKAAIRRVSAERRAGRSRFPGFYGGGLPPISPASGLPFRLPGRRREAGPLLPATGGRADGGYYSA